MVACEVRCDAWLFLCVGRTWWISQPTYWNGLKQANDECTKRPRTSEHVCVLILETSCQWLELDSLMVGTTAHHMECAPMAYTQWLDYGSRQREESFPFAASHMAHVSQPLPSDYTCYYSASAALQRRVPFPADPHVPRSTSLFDGEHVARLLKGNSVGDTVPFHPPLNLCGQFFQRASVERDFGTASKAQLMRFEPGGKLFICKFDNILQEYAVMCALEEMNRRWRQRKVSGGELLIHLLTLDLDCVV